MKQKYKTWIIFLAFGVFSMTLTLMLTLDDETKSLIERHQLSGLSLSNMVSTLENMLDENDGFSASINGEALILSDNLGSERIELPDHLFYLSVAPYIERTHTCTIHNLVTCRGELKEETFNIQVYDLETNELIINDEYTSASNGFIGLWLPKNRSLQITITYGIYTGFSEIQTLPSSPTCLTTLKLT